MKITIAILLGALLAWFAPRLAASVPPLPQVEAQAAPPEPQATDEPSDVPPCEEINTATVNGTGVITVFRCEPNEGPPYKLNSMGFMMDED